MPSKKPVNKSSKTAMATEEQMRRLNTLLEEVSSRLQHLTEVVEATTERLSSDIQRMEERLMRQLELVEMAACLSNEPVHPLH